MWVYPFTGRPAPLHQTTRRLPLTSQRSSKLVSDYHSTVLRGHYSELTCPTMSNSGGHLEPALEQYKRAKKFGVDRAELHIRNVGISCLFVSPVKADHLQSNPPNTLLEALFSFLQYLYGNSFSLLHILYRSVPKYLGSGCEKPSWKQVQMPTNPSRPKDLLDGKIVFTGTYSRLNLIIVTTQTDRG